MLKHLKVLRSIQNTKKCFCYEWHLLEKKFATIYIRLFTRLKYFRNVKDPNLLVQSFLNPMCSIKVCPKGIFYALAIFQCVLKGWHFSICSFLSLPGRDLYDSCTYSHQCTDRNERAFCQELQSKQTQCSCRKGYYAQKAHDIPIRYECVVGKS